MQSNQRRLRRIGSRSRVAVVIPAALLALTAFVSPSFADDAAPDDAGAPAAEPAPAPEPDPAPAPAPEPDPAPAPQPEPEPAPAPVPAPADVPEPAAEEAPEPQEVPEDVVPAGEGAKESASAVSAAPVPAAAPDNSKVVVCKWVTTPGGELDHIIIVSVNAIKDFPADPVFPWQFADAQDSTAIRYAEQGEQAKDVPLAECTGGQGEPDPVEIEPPVVPVTDDCGVGNAAYGTVPAGDYEVTLNGDGSITLTADDGFEFPGGEPTYTYPVPVETNTDECDDDQKKVVVCKYVSTPPGELHHIIIVNENAIGAGTNELGNGEPDHAWDGVTFPWYFADAHSSVAIRYAEDGEQAKDVDVAECPGDGEGEPDPIDVPEIPVDDLCGTGNASFGEVPEGNYDAVLNEDGSVTLTAHDGFVFPGDLTEVTIPAPTETNTEPCPVAAAIVACSVPSGGGDAQPIVIDEGVQPIDKAVVPTLVEGIVSLLDLLVAEDNGFAGSFPYSFTLDDQLVTLIRYAAEGETAEDLQGTIVCGIGGIDEPEPTDPGDPGDTDGEVLPATGGPMGWLLPVGVGFVLAGGLLVARRPRLT